MNRYKFIQPKPETPKKVKPKPKAKPKSKPKKKKKAKKPYVFDGLEERHRRQMYEAAEILRRRAAEIERLRPHAPRSWYRPNE